MKTFALACTTAMALGLGIQDAQEPPSGVEVSALIVCNWPNSVLGSHLSHQEQVWMHVALRHEL